MFQLPRTETEQASLGWMSPSHGGSASHIEVHQQLKTQLGIERTGAPRMEGYFVLTVFIFNSHLHGQKKKHA